MPFNRDEDPWVVAQAFIHKHDLPQSYLETVANFIISNAKIALPPLPSNQGYVDPYTGGARYVPPSNSSSSNNFSEQLGGQVSSGYNKFFPQTNYLKFDQANTTSILSELIFTSQKYMYIIYVTSKVLITDLL